MILAHGILSQNQIILLVVGNMATNNKDFPYSNSYAFAYVKETNPSVKDFLKMPLEAFKI